MLQDVIIQHRQLNEGIIRFDFQIRRMLICQIEAIDEQKLSKPNKRSANL